MRRITPSELKEIDDVIKTAKLMLKTDEIVLRNKKNTPLFILAEQLYAVGLVSDLIENVTVLHQQHQFNKHQKTMSLYVSPTYISDLFMMFDEVYLDQFKQKLQIRMKEAFSLNSKLVLEIDSAIQNALKEPTNDELVLKAEELVATSHTLVRIMQNISSHLENVNE